MFRVAHAILGGLIGPTECSSVLKGFDTTVFRTVAHGTGIGWVAIGGQDSICLYFLLRLSFRAATCSVIINWNEFRSFCTKGEGAWNLKFHMLNTIRKTHFGISLKLFFIKGRIMWMGKFPMLNSCRKIEFFNLTCHVLVSPVMLKRAVLHVLRVPNGRRISIPIQQ